MTHKARHITEIIVIDVEGNVAIVEYERTGEFVRRQRHELALRRFTLGRPIGSGKPRKKIVEAAILLHHDDDVFDGLAARGGRAHPSRQERGGGRAGAPAAGG